MLFLITAHIKQVVTNNQGQSKGFGFVNFAEQAPADEAVAKVNGMNICDAIVSVTKFVPKRERPAGSGMEGENTNVYVRDLPDDFTEENLRELFARFGNITGCNFKQTNDGRSFAFVNFESSESAAEVII